MKPTSTYFTFYVVGTAQEKLAIHKVSVEPGEIKFTGGWLFQNAEKDKIGNVVSDSYIFSVNDEVSLENPRLDFNKFVELCRLERNEALAHIESYKAEDQKKRKNLVVPDFWIWDDVDFANASEALAGLGIRSSIPGTEPEFEQVLTTSRLIQYLFTKWFNDENLRCEKKYLQSIYPTPRLYPSGWLKDES